MKKKLFLVGCMFLFTTNSVYGITKGSLHQAKETQQEIDVMMIDSQIQSLKELKEYYLAKASRVRSLGDRLQFSSQTDGLITAQKCWKSADEYDRIADQIQEQIDLLNKERKDVIKSPSY